MRMDKLTTKFQMALADAQSLAVGQDHQFIEPVHLMIALLDQQGGSVRGLLTKSGVNVNLLRSQLGDALDRLPKVEGAGGDVHLGNDLGKLLNVPTSWPRSATTSTSPASCLCWRRWTANRRWRRSSNRRARARCRGKIHRRSARRPAGR